MQCEAFPPPFHPTALIIARCHLQPPFVIGLLRSCHNHQGLPFSNSAFYGPADGPICSKWNQELPLTTFTLSPKLFVSFFGLRRQDSRLAEVEIRTQLRRLCHRQTFERSCRTNGGEKTRDEGWKKVNGTMKTMKRVFDRENRGYIASIFYSNLVRYRKSSMSVLYVEYITNSRL